LLLTRLFHGVLLGQSQPLDRVDHPITFVTEDNFCTRTTTFDVVDINLSYNVIGRSANSKFMAIPHYA
jgi:cytochrome c oxidase assembly protein Cox11